jgi:hypothetical protein
MRAADTEPGAARRSAAEQLATCVAEPGAGGRPRYPVAVRLAADLVLPRIRCAAAHGSTGADPAGSAPNWDAVVAVEVPLPWPKDISMAPPFDALAPEPSAVVVGGDGRRWRPQGLAPRSASTPGARETSGGVKVMAFERADLDDGATGPFQRREWRVADLEAAGGLLDALVGGDGAALSSFSADRDDPGHDVVDLLVCTHGTRDVCCGGSGAALHSELVAMLGAEEGPGFRVWRTSHAGGHRFAATAISLPDGMSWAHLAPEVAATVLRRDRPAAEVAAHCRGSVALAGSVPQVADREGLARHGWSWVARERVATVVAHERDTLATTVDVVAADGTGVRVRVELERHIPMPTCGTVVGPELATEAVWRAARVQVL